VAGLRSTSKIGGAGNIPYMRCPRRFDSYRYLRSHLLQYRVAGKGETRTTSSPDLGRNLQVEATQDATVTWKENAWRALRAFAASGAAFTVNDLLDLVGHPDQTHKPNGRNSAVGSLFAHASRIGLIESVGVRHATTPSRKQGMVRIWKGKATSSGST
jgi:hypothetical protein